MKLFDDVIFYTFVVIAALIMGAWIGAGITAGNNHVLSRSEWKCTEIAPTKDPFKNECVKYERGQQ